MAYDKVIDSAQLEAAITASANAIREKTGDTALIQWLAEKGFAEAIAAIEAGGEGVKLAYGSIVATQQYYLDIQHDLGEIPDFALLFQPGVLGGGYYNYLFYIKKANGDYFSGIYRYGSSSPSAFELSPSEGAVVTSEVPYNYKHCVYKATESSIRFGNESQTNYGVGSYNGNPMYWLVGVLGI